MDNTGRLVGDGAGIYGEETGVEAPLGARRRDRPGDEAQSRQIGKKAGCQKTRPWAARGRRIPGTLAPDDDARFLKGFANRGQSECTRGRRAGPRHASDEAGFDAWVQAGRHRRVAIGRFDPSARRCV